MVAVPTMHKNELEFDGSISYSQFLGEKTNYRINFDL